MRVVSDFKDYYDVGKAGDDEDAPVYRRFSALHWLVPGQDRAVAPAAIADAVRDLWRDDTVPPALRQPWERPPCPVERCVVGVCGRAHAVYVVHDEVRVVDGGGKERAAPRCCGSFEQLQKAVDDRVAWWRGHDAEKSRAWGALAEQLQHRAPDRWRRRRERAFDDDVDAESWARFVARQSTVVPPRLFVALGAPVVAHFDDRVVVHPSLRALGFQSQLAPQQLWQELSLYLGNTLVELTTPPPQPISDALRAETHGFDRQSFRTKKGGRKKLDRSEW